MHLLSESRAASLTHPGAASRLPRPQAPSSPTATAAAGDVLLKAFTNVVHRNHDRLPPRPPPRNTHGMAPPAAAGSLQPDMISFSGTEYVFIGSTAGLGLVESSYTIEAWVRIHAYQAEDNTIMGADVCKEQQTLHVILRDGRPRQGHYHHDEMATEVLELHRWYHLAFTYDIARRRHIIMLNGEVITVSAREMPPVIGSVDLNLSRWNGTRTAGILLRSR